MSMLILGWIIVGAVAGWIAARLMNSGGDIFSNIGIGIVGALLGGWISSALGGPGLMGAFTLWSLFVAVAGAVILILIIRAIRGSRA